MNKLLAEYLASLKQQHAHRGVPDAESHLILKQEEAAKRPYCDPSFGQVEVLVIVSALDECTITLQELGKSDFLEPLGWDFLPSPAVLATVQCVLLLFNLDAGNAPPSVVWSGVWAAWIVKNIDTHIGGWEWLASNEPVGLFTKPYELCTAHLRTIQTLHLPSTYAVPDDDPSWQRMPAYLCLRNWVAAAVAYLNMKTHCISSFPLHGYVTTVTAPPKRTPKENVWFSTLTDEHVPIYYNRHLKTLALDKPLDFDGANIVVPRTIEALMMEMLMGDPILRADVEARRVQMDIDLDKDNEWIECVDATTSSRFYYSFQRFKLAYMRPASKNIVAADKSVAFRCVLRIQSAYRRRQAMQFVNQKRQKTRKLPRFTSRNFF
ncbi:hypothetical protein, variant [Aphanomyces invadans]|uniref:Uncharacterized protein n=1 Tax=Aphanomyces invadans TaxID=157072 RepID=A0A024U4W3_9STRA|nr:hypothetical protein, variant [Aphanomyces invadans]ETW00673.1 hypothetical protein, variant [Aphanomyces invadans]|eukprot:XP_008870808.1 hypothetical protein, variant [Aphanomyces invadans]